MNQQNADLLNRRQKLLGEKAALFYQEPVHLVRGKGVWLYDAQGKAYLDFYNNVSHLGHAHPSVVRAITKQLKLLNTHTRYLHEAILNYGEKLIATLDKSLSMLFLTNSGSEANDLAMRIARTYTGGVGFICTDAAYHGNTEAVAELSTIFTSGKTNCQRVRCVSVPNLYRLPEGVRAENAADVFAQKVQEEIDAFKADGIRFAGLMFCSTFSTDGILTMPEGYMRKVVDIVHQAGGLYISDEVQAGLGRMGKMWGFEWEGILPDIVTMGKPMGNGYPLAAVVTRPELGNPFQTIGGYFNTFAGSPVACAAGLAVLEVIENQNLIENAIEIGQFIKEELLSLRDEFEFIGDVRGRGLFLGLELVEDKVSKKHATVLTDKLVNQLAKNGVLLRQTGVHKNVLKMRPPMVLRKSHAYLFLNRLYDILRNVNG